MILTIREIGDVGLIAGAISLSRRKWVECRTEETWPVIGTHTHDPQGLHQQACSQIQ